MTMSEVSTFRRLLTLGALHLTQQLSLRNNTLYMMDDSMAPQVKCVLRILSQNANRIPPILDGSSNIGFPPVSNASNNALIKHISGAVENVHVASVFLPTYNASVAAASAAAKRIEIELHVHLRHNFTGR